ncbi:MAG: hypothetical protein V8Q57_08710 [Blautia sp.]
MRNTKSTEAFYIIFSSHGKEFLEKLSEGKCPYQIVFMDIILNRKHIRDISIASI